MGIEKSILNIKIQLSGLKSKSQEKLDEGKTKKRCIKTVDYGNWMNMYLVEHSVEIGQNNSNKSGAEKWLSILGKVRKH